MLPKRSCHGNINIDACVATTSRCSQIIFRKGRKVGNYGGHSLNGFEVTQLLREGGSKSPSGLKRVKLSIAWMEMDCSFEKKMANYLKVVFIRYRKMSPIIEKKMLIACLSIESLNIILLEFQVRQKMAENTYLEFG